VLDSDNIAKTVKAAVAGRMGNAGQACNAAKRIIVVGDLYDEFAGQFTAAMAALHPGDPTDPASDLGPLSSEAAAERLIGQISDAVDKGATLRTGGKRVDRPGAFVEPTVLTDVTPQMRAYHEELFGPAASSETAPPIRRALPRQRRPGKRRRGGALLVGEQLHPVQLQDAGDQVGGQRLG
jgi:succinate-semialdehyde dehydrogenase/glutarate-semialdehyde dehydrogenase